MKMNGKTSIDKTNKRDYNKNVQKKICVRSFVGRAGHS